MARKQPKVEQAELLEQEPEVEAEERSTDRKAMSKAGAARAALAEGITVPREAVVYIKDTYDIKMSPQQFSAEKCRLKARSAEPDFNFQHDAKGSRPEISGGIARRVEVGEPDLLESLEVMKPLIDRLGAEKVKRMVDLLG